MTANRAAVTYAGRETRDPNKASVHVIKVPEGARYMSIPKGFVPIFKNSIKGEWYTTDQALNAAEGGNA